MRRWRATLLGTLAALALLAASWRVAGAHAYVIASDPPGACTPAALPGPVATTPASTSACDQAAALSRPPDVVRVRFSEPVTPFAGGLHVISPSGRRVDQGPARPTGTGRAASSELSVPVMATEEGTYAVSWRVTSADTHPAQGSFTFSVGHASAPPPGLEPAGTDVAPLGLALQALGRWLHVAGFALASGVLAFRTWVLSPALRRGSDTGPGASLDDEIDRRLWRLVLAGVLLLLAAEPVALLGQTASLDAPGLLDPDAVAGALDSPFGRALAVRLGAATLLWTLCSPARDETASRAALSPAAAGRWTTAMLAIGLLLAFFDGTAGHATSARPAGAAVLLEGVHRAAMGLWAGGLAALLAIWALPPVAPHRRALTWRFGRLAAAAAVALVATGIGLASLLGLRPANFLALPYGQTLTAKVAVLLLALLAAAAARRAHPTMAPRRWRLEAAALAALLVLAALLATLPPPP